MYYEYKVINISDMALDVIEERLNAYASGKWRVVATASSSWAGSWGTFILLERERGN